MDSPKLNTKNESSNDSTTDISTSSTLQSKFQIISKSICTNYIKKNIMHIIVKQNAHLNDTLYLQLIYKKNTDLNPLNYNMVFSITVDNEYPNSIPLVKCVTNFCFPTLFDSRNLIFSIINHNWVNKNSKYSKGHEPDTSQLIEPLEEIIIRIPKFVDRLIENTNNKILVYYGDYKIDMIYDMNEFLSNLDLDFYKIYQFVRSKKGPEKVPKERYVVVSDIYFLLFDPVPSSKNLGKLLFWGDIRQSIPCRKSPNSYSSECVLLEWKSGNKIIQFEISILNGSTNEFIEKSTRKLVRLKEQYKIFQDDLVKPVETEQEADIISKTKELSINSDNIEKFVLLVKYKEELLEKQHSINLVRELMSLYQKIIEIKSAKGDTDFTIYLEKLHVMLTHQDTQQELEKENVINQTSNKSQFELSKYYHIDESEVEVDSD